MNRKQILQRGWPILAGSGIALVVLNLIAQMYLLAGALTLGVIGLGLNVLVLSSNSWRMPVRNRIIDTDRHVTLRPGHRFPYLADIWPVGVIVISPGDAFIAASWVCFVVGVFLT